VNGGREESSPQNHRGVGREKKANWGKAGRSLKGLFKSHWTPLSTGGDNKNGDRTGFSVILLRPFQQRKTNVEREKNTQSKTGRNPRSW